MTDKKEQTKEHLQQYLQNYWTAPSIFGSVEPFVVDYATDPTVGGYNIAKSAYQTRHDVFNLDYVAREVGITKDEIESRLKKMIDDHTIMLVLNGNVFAMGFSIYSWLVKLRDGCTPEQREEVTNFMQNQDETCSDIAGEGDFDFLLWNHIGVLDFLLNTIIKPVASFPQVENIHICPVARYVREEKVAHWRAPMGTTREFYITDEEIERFPEVQTYWDETDVKIYCALNKKRPVEDFFNFSVLAELSGLKAEDLKGKMKSYVEELPIMIPLFVPNWRKLGLTKHFFVVRLYRGLPTKDKFSIVDELATNPVWETLWQFTQGYYDIIVSAYKELNDIDKLRAQLRAIPGVEEIREFDAYRMLRRWTCRLDEEDGFWENCVMTNDIGIDGVDPKENELYPYGEYSLREEDK